MKYKIITGIIIFAGVVFFAGKYLREKKPEPNNIAEEGMIKVQRGNISVFINVAGVVKPLNVIELRSRVSGKIIKMPARKGDYLKEGALIAEVENTFIKSVLPRFQEELNSAQTRFKKLIAEIEAEKKEDQWLIKAAEGNLEKAKYELQKAIEKEKIKEALKKNNIVTESELLKQEVDMQFNINDIQEKISKLNKKEPVPKKELEALNVSLKTARSEYELVLQYLEMTKKPIMEEKIDVEKFGIKQAKIELEKTREKIKAKRSREQEIIAAEAEVLKKQEALKLAEDNMKDSIITAPVSGLILEAVEKDRIISPEMLANSTGAVIAVMTDLSKVIIAFKVDKKDLSNIKTGRQVNITTDRFPGDHFEGRIAKIIPEKAVQAGAEIYEITVEIENPDTLLNPGMNLMFKIVIREKKNVLLVPSDTIQSIDNKRRLFIIKDGKLIKREVKTGINDRAFTEIISGLNEGEFIKKRKKTVKIDLKGGY